MGMLFCNDRSPAREKARIQRDTQNRSKLRGLINVFSRVKSAMEAINKNERLFARALRLDISSPDTMSFATFQKKRLFSD